MVVALGTTLIDLNMRNLIYKGPVFSRIEDGYTTGADIFIGAFVTKYGQARPTIDLCGEDEPLMGIVLGYTNRNEPDSQGFYYRDFDNPFAASKWVQVGIIVPGQVLWVLSGTQKDINRGDPLKIVTGIADRAGTGDQIKLVSEEDVVAAANTRKYFRAKVVSA